MSPRSLIAPLVVLALLVALVAAFGASSRETRVYDAWLENLHDMRELDTSMNELTLELRFGLVTNYDQLVELMQASERAEVALAAFPRLGGATERGATESLVAAIRHAAETKRGALEEFKSTNAVLANSHRFFPQAVVNALAEAHADADLAIVRDLISDTLQLTGSGSGAAAERLPERIAALAPVGVSSESLRVLDSHARILESYTPLANELLDTVLAAETPARIDALESHVRAVHGRMASQRNRQRLVLSALLALLLVHALGTWRSLRRKTSELHAVNTGLEQRIRERTQEISERNAELRREVDERVRAERGLEATLTELERSHRELNELHYATTHHLQEPLRRLVSFSELLAQDAGELLPHEAAHDLEFIIRSAHQMKAQLEDAVDLAAVGRAEFKPERIPLDRPLGVARRRLAAVIARSGAHIESDQLPDVQADPQLVALLLHALLDNAIKFSAPGTPRLHVTCEKGDGGPVLGVRDEGVGMDPSYATEIFAPFQRLHGVDEYAGTGIGLAIARKIVERHGGAIWVESERDVGSHFRFTLGPGPCADVRSEAQVHQLSNG